MSRLKSIIKLIRVYQWTKSGFIFFPFVFSSNLHAFFRDPFGPGSMLDMQRLLLAFFGFSFLASAGYILNDWKDRELDRQDERKKHRPLASGALSPFEGILIAGLLLAAGAYMGYLLGYVVLIVFFVYFFFNQVLYSYIGKNIILIDVFSIAIGFVLRVMAGSLALQIEFSHYLLSCTFFIALFLGFSKRWDELKTGSREVLLGGSYNIETLRNFINISAALAIVNYAIYTIEGRHKAAHLIYTVPLVVLGVFRYYVITHDPENLKKGGNPSDLLLADKFLIGIVLVWVALCAALILTYEPAAGP